MPAQPISSPTSTSHPPPPASSPFQPSSLPSSSSLSSWISSNSNGFKFSFSASTLRTALIVTMFTVVVIQLELALNKFYSSDHAVAPPCPSILDGFKQNQQQPLNVPKQQAPATAALRVNDDQQIKEEEQRRIMEGGEGDEGDEALPTTAVGLNPPNSKELPEVNEKGMIIFYLHIPKTGGTTIMAPFERNPHWRYRMVYGWNKQDKYRQEMYDTLHNWEPGMKIFYEYHAGLSSPYMDLTVREDLLKWRAMAQVRKIPFFAFTVLREPLSFAVSHFNYYYASRKKGDTRYFFVPDPTEDDFVKLTLPNPQCLFCVHTEQAYYQSYREKGKPIHVPQEGCEAVYESFKTELDWVGTTESLSSETFPIIEHVGNVRYHPMHSTKNKSQDKIVKSKLKPETVTYIRDITKFDLNMYENAKRDFPLSMWSNFDQQVQRPKRLPSHVPHLKMKQFDKPDLLGHEQRKREKQERKQQRLDRKNGKNKKNKNKNKNGGNKQQQDGDGDGMGVRKQFPMDQPKVWNTAH